MIDPQKLVELGVLPFTAVLWAPAISRACEKYGITTSILQAHFLAQILIESDYLSRLVENLNYSAVRMAQVWPNRFSANGKPNSLARSLANNPELLANEVYANRMGNGDQSTGDGWAFRGVGPAMITGKANHQMIAEALGVEWGSYNPNWLTEPKPGARSAAIFFNRNGIAQAAADDDAVAVSKLWNGGTVGLKQRLELTEMAMEVLA